MWTAACQTSRTLVAQAAFLVIFYLFRCRMISSSKKVDVQKSKILRRIPLPEAEANLPVPPVISNVVTPSFMVHIVGTSGGVKTAISQTLPPLTTSSISSPFFAVIATVAVVVKGVGPGKFPAKNVCGVTFIRAEGWSLLKSPQSHDELTSTMAFPMPSICPSDDAKFPTRIASWEGKPTLQFSDKILAVLGVDEYVSRVYSRPSRTQERQLVYFWFQAEATVMRMGWVQTWHKFMHNFLNRNDGAFVRVSMTLPKGKREETEQRAKQFLKQSCPSRLNSGL